MKYNFLLFIRNLKRQKLFSFINLLGLTVSITATILIYLYVDHEFSYDRFHKNADRIYRINQTFIWGENNDTEFASTGPGVAYAIKEELPEVELITSIHTPGDFIVSYTNAANEVLTFEEDNIFAADTNFFKMFTFEMVKGNAASALREANTLVLSESTAKKYFGPEDPIGKMVYLGTPNSDNRQAYEVTGVVKDVPENTYFQFDILLSTKGFPIERFYWSWIWTQLETYVRLNENAKLEDVKAKLATIPRKHAEETLQKVMNMSFDDYIKSGKNWELFIQPLTDIHLPEKLVINRLNDSGNLKIIYSMIGAGIFIVLLSCVNFMNLSTAQFTRRIKEASIRKILGLGKKQLGFSYFFEALSFCLISLAAALALTQLILPAFNLVSGKQLALNLMTDPAFIPALLILVLTMAAASSSYPALFLSSFNPVAAIKGKSKVGREGKVLRNGLVVFQFVVSIILIICTAIVFQQLSYVSDKDIGFNKENLLVISHAEAATNEEALTNAARAIPGVKNATLNSSLPPGIYSGDKFSAEGMSDNIFSLNYTSGDEEYVPTLGVTLKVGRNFSINNPSDRYKVILNETAVKQIGWHADESVIGKRIHFPYDTAMFEVIGVVQDFNYWTLAAPIAPMAIFHVNNNQVHDRVIRFLALRLDTESAQAVEATVASLNKLWKQHAGDTPFEYEFVDQAFAETFKTHQQFGKALTVMAGLAILIASLGLLGMIIYALEQRTKEIGIRKVSGASVWDILMLISRSYATLIFLAFLIAAPAAYWIMLQWLQDFSYRVTPSAWIFLGTGVGTMTVAILITSYHSVKAALTNPVEVLRDE